MRISVHGTHARVSDKLRDYATEKVTHVQRIFDGIISAEVEFREERNPRVADKEVVEVTMTTTTGTLIRATGHAPDAHAAVDAVVGRLERQVRKLKDKLVSRSHPHKSRASGNSRHSSGDDDDEGESPRIVRTKSFDMKPMTAEEAALQMDMLGHDFYLFTNAESGVNNVVYRRRDGHVGLIEPAR